MKSMGSSTWRLFPPRLSFRLDCLNLPSPFHSRKSACRSKSCGPTPRPRSNQRPHPTSFTCREGTFTAALPFEEVHPCADHWPREKSPEAACSPKRQSPTDQTYHPNRGFQECPRSAVTRCLGCL